MDFLNFVMEIYPCWDILQAGEIRNETEVAFKKTWHVRLPLALKMKELWGREGGGSRRSNTHSHQGLQAWSSLELSSAKIPTHHTSRLSGDLYIAAQGGSNAASKTPGKAARATNQASWTMVVLSTPYFRKPCPGHPANEGWGRIQSLVFRFQPRETLKQEGSGNTPPSGCFHTENFWRFNVFQNYEQV